jgi:hypothetical protein
MAGAGVQVAARSRNAAKSVCWAPGQPVWDVKPLIFVAPLGAARTKRRTKIETLLLARGAKEDIFTHAFLGDLDLRGDSLSSEHALVLTSMNWAPPGDRRGLAALEPSHSGKPQRGGHASSGPEKRPHLTDRASLDGSLPGSVEAIT